MEVVKMPIGDLKEADYNPRLMRENQVEQLKKSLQQFGFVEPIVVNSHPERKNIIIGGHQRVRVAKLLGIQEIPCVFVNLDLEKEKELNLRLNKNLGEWDWDKLPNFEESMLLEVGFEESFIQGGVDSDIKKILENPDANMDSVQSMPEFGNDKIGERKPVTFWFENEEDFDKVHSYFAGDRKMNYDSQKLLDLLDGK